MYTITRNNQQLPAGMAVKRFHSSLEDAKVFVHREQDQWEAQGFARPSYQVWFYGRKVYELEGSDDHESDVDS